MSSNEPDSSRGEVDCRQEVSRGLVIAGGDGSKLLELAEKVLNEMPRLVEFLVIGTS